MDKQEIIKDINVRVRYSIEKSKKVRAFLQGINSAREKKDDDLEHYIDECREIAVVLDGIIPGLEDLRG